MILHTSQNNIIMLQALAQDIHQEVSHLPMISITILERRGKVGIFYITVQKKVCSYNAFAGCVNLVLDSTAVCILTTFTVTVIDVTSTNRKLLSYVGSIAIGKCCPM